MNRLKSFIRETIYEIVRHDFERNGPLLRLLRNEIRRQMPSRDHDSRLMKGGTLNDRLR